MPRHRSKQNKKSLRKDRKSLRKDRKKLRNTRKNLRKSRKNTRRQEKPKKRSNRTLKLRGKKNKQRGGNKPLMVPAAFEPASNPVYPPGGIYKPGACDNGLGGGYYYGLNECGTSGGMRPAPASTIGGEKFYNNKDNNPTNNGYIQSGGDPVSSLGGIRNIFRNMKYRMDNFSAKFSGERLPTNPNAMVQPVNDKVFYKQQ